MLLFLVVSTALLTIIGLIVYMLLASSAGTSKVVLNEQEKYGIYSSTVVKGIFGITALQFSDPQNASCTQSDDYLRPATMTLRFHTYQVPDSCAIFVENKLVRTERRLDPDCFGSCPFSEFDRQFSLGLFDYRDSHNIKVCCNDICIEKTLQTLCTPAGTKE